MTYGPAEMMCIALAREIQEGQVVFHGLASPVPMTAMKLAKAMGKEYSYVSITDGVDPDYTRPAYNGSTLSTNLYDGSVATFGLDEIFDYACSGRVDISFLSLIEISQAGEINMTYVGGDYHHPKVRLPGGAGSATLTPVTLQTTIWKTKHDARSFVKNVQFCTAKADPAKKFKVFTNLCIFAMKDGLLEVEAIYPYTTLDEVKANTGWEISQIDVPVVDPPTERELDLLEQIDPNHIRDIEF